MSTITEKKIPYLVRPHTAVLTRGFDPRLSVGSARPGGLPLLDLRLLEPGGGRASVRHRARQARSPTPGENVDLIYSRLSHPNAEILEDQIVPLEPGATGGRRLQLGHGRHLDRCSSPSAGPGRASSTRRRSTAARAPDAPAARAPRHAARRRCRAGDGEALRRAIAATPNLRLVFIETPANPTLRMTDIAAAGRGAGAPRHAARRRRQHVPRPGLPAPADARRRPGRLLGHQVPVGLQRHARRGGPRPRPRPDRAAARHAGDPRQHPAARRVLDARRPAAHRGAAHEPAEQERAAHRRGARRPPEGRRDATTRRCSTTPSRSASATPSATSRARSSPSRSAAASPRPSTSCAP